jgi:hypothetical protein
VVSGYPASCETEQGQVEALMLPVQVLSDSHSERLQGSPVDVSTAIWSQSPWMQTDCAGHELQSLSDVHVMAVAP